MEDTNSNSNNNSETTWNCPTCTLINQNESAECVACGTSRDGNTENSTAVWTCEYCTTFNQMSTEVCISCGLPMGTNADDNLFPMNTNTDYDSSSQSARSNELINRALISLMRSYLRENRDTMPANLTPREKAEYYAYDGSECRCNVCKVRAARRIIGLNQTARTDEQKELAAIMMNEILPAIINTSFNSDMVLQVLASGNTQTLEQVLDRSLAEYEGHMIPANNKEMEELKCVEIKPKCLDCYHDQDTCVVCMEKFDLNQKDIKITEMPCGHIFHHDCLNKWLTECDASCPICKHRINKKLDIIKKDDTLDSNDDIEEQQDKDSDDDLDNNDLVEQLKEDSDDDLENKDSDDELNHNDIIDNLSDSAY